jgi:dolichyl-diphosphooligosaccharide--protein glycosyltransferase
MYFILFCASLYLYYLAWQGSYIFLAIITLCIVVYSLYGIAKNINRSWLPLISILTLFIGFVLIFYPYAMDSIGNLFNYTKSILHGNFSLATEEDRLSLQAIWGNFGLCFFITIAGVIITLCKIKNNPKLIILLIWSFTAIIITLMFQRFLYYLAINVAILTAITSATLWNYVTKLSTDQMRKMSTAALLIIVIVLPLIPAINNVGKPQPSTMSNQWQDALIWLKDNTAEPFDNSDYYYADYSRDLKQPNYTILTWWDYGYWITRETHRVPIINPSGNSRTKVAQFLTSTNLEQANAIADKLKTEYIIIDYSMTTDKLQAIIKESQQPQKDNMLITQLWNGSVKGYELVYQSPQKYNQVKIFRRSQ